MKIGARMRSEWMNFESEDNLLFLKQIGVDYVDIHLTMLQGYTETGVFEQSSLSEMVERLGAVGIKIQRASAFVPRGIPAHLGLPEGQREIENMCKVVEMLGAADVPVYGLQPFSAAFLVEQNRPGWSVAKSRGGYEHVRFSLDAAESLDYEPEVRITREQLWENLINIYEQVVPVAEQAGVKIGNHGIDPPLPYIAGNPQILCSFADYDRLFAEVPSPNNCMTFCVGTRYESGEDIFEGIKHFGGQGKIAHVHFRNVRGTLPSTRGYEEVFEDDGDMDMREVALALEEVGYDGVMDYDHIMSITGDDDKKQYIAYAVGYMRAIAQSLPERSNGGPK